MPVCDATTNVCCVSYYAVLSKMELKGVAPDQQTFGTLVKAYSRAKDPAGAEKVLERMSRYDVPKNSRKPPPKSSGEGNKLKAGVVEYSTVVSAYAALGDMPSALRVIEDMAAAKVRPNERTFAHLTWGYGQLDDVAGITQSAQLMVDEGRGLHSFPFPLNLSLLCPFPLNLSVLCPPHNPT